MRLSIAPELLGQVLVCPHCSSQFQVAAGAAAGQPTAAPPPAAPTPVWRGDPDMLAAGLKLNDPPPPAPRPQVAVPRFKPVDPSAAAVSLTQNGTLPELSLADAKHPPKAAVQAEKQPQTLMLTVLVAISLTLSVCLSFVDFSPGTGNATTREQARYQIAGFYGQANAPLEPYQLLLRDAQRAHSRGDRATERAKYREVLRRLRAENRSASLTETRDGDHELEAAIAIVLGDE
ncbi:MAG TPA: hypothetical protein VNH11_25600 [Pirellulales bacterium]|nr:hypothetical protein [Pirellulales bacterium]